MKKIAIMQPTYLPWLGYFSLMDRVDTFVILDSVQFDKRSWQQRNRIKTPHGEHILTVPVLTKNRFYQKINEVEIVKDSNFVEDHIKAIQLNYAKAPFFNTYFKDLAALLRKDHHHLFDLNIDIIRWLKESFNIRTEIVSSSQLEPSGAKVELLVDICTKLDATGYLSPAGSKIYMNESDLFALKNIKVEYQDYQPMVYTQLFGEFIPYLSAIDLLFNEGERSLAVIQAGERLLVSHGNHDQ